MKNSLKYLKLWQKKRSELQINDDPHTDWLQMQAMLDKQMPVGVENESKLFRSKGFKVLSLLLSTLTAAAMVFVFSHVFENKKHRAYNFSSHIKRYKAFKANGSLPGLVAGNSNTKGLPVNKTDSISVVKQKESPATTPLVNKPGNRPLSPQLKSNTLPLKGQSKSVTVIVLNFNNKQALSSSTRSMVIGWRYPGTGKNGSSLGAITNSRVFNQAKIKETHNKRSKSSEAPDFTDKAGSKTEESVLLFAAAPKPAFNLFENDDQFYSPAVLNFKTNQSPFFNNFPNDKNSKGKKKKVKEKNVKTKNSISRQSDCSNLDWGILTGVNTAGSFTPKNQNSNFYGAAPVDLFFGVFVTYNLNEKWALNSQIKILSPQNVSYSYVHLNNGMVDSPKMQIKSARKIYSVEVPVQLAYRVNSYLSVLAGPSISIPVKQAGITNKLFTNGAKKDSAYYAAVGDTINSTKYLQKLNVGLSGGLNLQIQRLRIGAMWNQSLTGYEIKSAFGAYKTKPGTFQFTIGWQLDKIKRK
jgi:hypothetical protein